MKTEDQFERIMSINLELGERLAALKAGIIFEKCHLEDLPDGSVVREINTASQYVFWNAGDGIWCIPADDTSYATADIHLPVRVLDFGGR